MQEIQPNIDNSADDVDADISISVQPHDRFEEKIG